LPVAFAHLLLAHPLILPAGLLSAVAAPYAMLHGLSEPTLVATFAFVALIFIGELARVALPGDREASPLATAGGLALAVTDSVGGTAIPHGTMATISCTALASLAGAMVHAAVGRSPRLDTIARRVLVVGPRGRCSRSCAPGSARRP
jgi:hypothetical protein